MWWNLHATYIFRGLIWIFICWLHANRATVLILSELTGSLSRWEWPKRVATCSDKVLGTRNVLGKWKKTSSDIYDNLWRNAFLIFVWHESWGDVFLGDLFSNAIVFYVILFDFIFSNVVFSNIIFCYRSFAALECFRVPSAVGTLSDY